MTVQFRAFGPPGAGDELHGKAARLVALARSLLHVCGRSLPLTVQAGKCTLPLLVPSIAQEVAKPELMTASEPPTRTVSRNSTAQRDVTKATQWGLLLMHEEGWRDLGRARSGEAD